MYEYQKFHLKNPVIKEIQRVCINKISPIDIG
jgi:hypothetical protein